MKDDSILFLISENEPPGCVIFEEGNGYKRKFTIMYKTYELISTLIERYRNKSNNFNKNIRFIHNGETLKESLTAYNFINGGKIIVSF